MKRLILVPLVALVVAGCEQATEPEKAAVSSLLQSSSGSAGYRAIDLGTLGGDYSYAYDINNGGQVVGYSATALGQRHAFLWEDGEMTDLGTLGGDYSSAYGINNRGQVVGYSTTGSGSSHNFLWQNGEMTDLGTLGTPECINDRGQVAGYRWTGSSYRAFLWEDGEMTDLGTLGGDITWAYRINELGQLVGSSTTKSGFWHGTLWTQ